jgi:hypothetical protein
MNNDSMPIPETSVDALKQCVEWIEHHKARIHHPVCTAIIEPSARCSCGLHKVLTNLRGVIYDITEGAAEKQDREGSGEDAPNKSRDEDYWW